MQNAPAGPYKRGVYSAGWAKSPYGAVFAECVVLCLRPALSARRPCGGHLPGGMFLGAAPNVDPRLATHEELLLIVICNYAL